jgi:hypothetical protein
VIEKQVDCLVEVEPARHAASSASGGAVQVSGGVAVIAPTVHSRTTSRLA